MEAVLRGGEPKKKDETLAGCLSTIVVLALFFTCVGVLGRDSKSSASITQPLSIEIERYQNTADSGANVKVMNPNSIEIDNCSIEVGDSSGKDRWVLRQPTVLDAEGLRSYPTPLFTDWNGTLPTANAIRYVLIKCSSPRYEQEFHINGKTAQKPVEAKRKPKKPEPEPEPEQDYEDVLSRLRQEAGETTPKPVERGRR